MSCLSVCDSRTLVYAVPEHRSSQYCLPSVIKSDNVPTGGPRVQMSVSHSIAATLSPITRETVGASTQEIVNTADLTT